MRAADRFCELVVGRGHALAAAAPLPWLTGRGHVEVEADLPGEIQVSLCRIFALLDGDEDALRRKPARSVAPDFLLGDTDAEYAVAPATGT